MLNGISTEVVKLDLKEILKNYKKPEFWQRKWTVLDMPTLTIVWYITNIDCQDNKISSVVEISRKNIKQKTSYWTFSSYLPSIPINNDEYTQQHFENALYGAVIRLLEKLEENATTYYAEYLAARDTQEQVKNKLEEIAIAFLDDHGISNDSVRDAYIEAFVDTEYSNSPASDLIFEIIKNYKYKILLNEYIYASAWFNRKDDYEYYSTIYYTDRKKKSTIFKIWNECRKIQTKAWEESMRDRLTEI